MMDRAMQALHLLALDPVAETTADKNSYGFRQQRSCADAIQQCFNVLTNANTQWLLEGDIRSCFDRISHGWLVAHVPMDRVILQKWLKSGYMDKHVFHETTEGTPQGERLEQLGWSVAVMEAIPDVISEISERLATLADGGQVAAIFTTGGTGVAPRDVTPEAARAILDREIPGFGELMRLRGRAATPLAVLSRSLAGTRGKVLIVTLPGSPKGAVESLDAIVELVPHVLELLRGHTEH